MNVNIWSNVAIAMQSAIAASANITAVSKANPGVATAANTLTTGDYVLLTATGMRPLNERVVRAASASAPSFSLEGVDTTAFDTFLAGTFQKITYGTSLATVTDVKASGGDFKVIDITTIHDDVGKELPGLASAIKFEFENIWDPADTALAALLAASDIQSPRAFLITFKTGAKLAFNATVGAKLIPGGKSGDKVTTSVTLYVLGPLQFYAS